MKNGMWTTRGPAYISLVRTGVNIQRFKFPVSMYISGAGTYSYGGEMFDEMPGHEISDLTARLKREGFM